MADHKLPKVDFNCDYAGILEKIDRIDPAKYARTRNYTDGSVTYLSPYISRGVISTRLIFEALKAKGYSLHQMEKLVSELAWRDYFQQVYRALGEKLFADIRQVQPDVVHYQMIASLKEAKTGIIPIDKHIQHLYATGYMHNHVRMYVASIACNIGKAHWQAPASWLYYNLLDGDIASNTCSWQWVAAAFSSKKYYCNQENINRFTGDVQSGTYLDQPYETIAALKIPNELSETFQLSLSTKLPASKPLVIDQDKPILLYNSYNLDPNWHQNTAANRILVLEPSHFQQFPVSENVMDFILGLSGNIPGIQIFTGGVNDIPGIGNFDNIYYKEHPTARHYPGSEEPRDWLVPGITGYFPSFFSYYKKIEKWLI